MDVREQPEHERYVIEVDGDVAGFSEYERHGERYVFVHTVVEDEYSGQGVGSRLARGLLEDLRSRGELLVPQCPFIAGYIERHPEYRDLVDEELTEALADDA